LLSDGGGSSSSTPGLQLSVPKELWRMVDDIYRHGMSSTDRDLFIKAGVPAEIELIRECLDTGIEFERHSVHSMCEALLLWLAALREPVIASERLPSGEFEVYEGGRRFLENLPPVSYNAFIYILSFLRELLIQSDQALSLAPKLSMIFAQCFTRVPPGAEGSTGRSMHVLLAHFMTTMRV
jgi:phosphatidylinositol-bisphosphatase